MGKLEALAEITVNQKPNKQDLYVYHLKDIYDITISQGEISKYFTELGIKKDTKLGYYVLSEQIVKQQKQEELQALILDANCKIRNEKFVQLLFKCNPLYAPLVCTSIENYFSDYEVGAISSPTGTIALYVPENKEKKIRKELEIFFVDDVDQ